MHTTIHLTRTPRLDYLPVGFFGAVMGLTGLSVAWKRAAELFALALWPSQALAAVATAAFAALVLAYGTKTVTAWPAVRAEFSHPVAGSLFGTVFISLLLLPLVLAPVSLALARLLWTLGAAGMIWFAWVSVLRWMGGGLRLAHASPSWIIPVVGLLDLPLAHAALDLPLASGLLTFALAVGLFFALPLFTLIFARLLISDPLPDPLKPSLLILSAPFTVGSSAYASVTERNDLFGDALFWIGLFLITVILPQLRHLPSCCPFRIGWWAVSFPLAAAAIAGSRHASTAPGLWSVAIALVLLALATLVILGLLARTLVGVAQGELRALNA